MDKGMRLTIKDNRVNEIEAHDAKSFVQEQRKIVDERHRGDWTKSASPTLASAANREQDLSA